MARVFPESILDHRSFTSTGPISPFMSSVKLFPLKVNVGLSFWDFDALLIQGERQTRRN
jgi:hypothetical protein